MKINDKDNNKFINVLRYVDQHPTGKYILEYNDTKLTCEFVTMFESNNGLDSNDKKYDEYFAIVFHNLDNDVDFELRYDYLPNKIYHETVKIFDLVGFKK